MAEVSSEDVYLLLPQVTVPDGKLRGSVAPRATEAVAAKVKRARPKSIVNLIWHYCAELGKSVKRVSRLDAAAIYSSPAGWCDHMDGF